MRIEMRPGALSVGAARWRWVLLAGEALWYALVMTLVLTGRLSAGYGPRRRVEFFVLVVLAGLCALVALARWWVPRLTGPAAIVVLALGVLVLTVLPVGPLGAMRQMLSRAVVPVLVAASVRRTGRWTALAVGVLAVTVAFLDVARGTGGFTLAADFARAVSPAGAPRTLVLLLGSALWAVLPIGAGLVMRSVDSAARNRALTAARTEERLQVARELHDMVANHVTGIVVTAQMGGMAVERRETTETALADIEAAGDRALDAMQRMVTALRSADVVDLQPALVTSPAGAAGRAAPADVVRRAVDGDPAVRLRLDTTVTGGGPTPGTAAHPEIVTTLQRVLTESLTNAHRHMPDGGVISVAMSAPAPETLCLEVGNERGAGPGRVRGSGFGLVGLRERVTAVGGTFEAGPVDEHHWRVRAELPHRPPSS